MAAFLAMAPRPKDCQMQCNTDVASMQMREIFVDLTKMMNKGKTEKRTMKVFPLSRLSLIHFASQVASRALLLLLLLLLLLRLLLRLLLPCLRCVQTEKA